MFMRVVRAVLFPVFVAGIIASAAIAGQAPAPPTDEQLKIYETFRGWITTQPDLRQASDEVVFERYAQELVRQGLTEAQVTSRVATIRSLGDRAEIERWNRILTAENPRFNTAPNAFLVEMTKGLKPGRSLDVGMGQGRNTIYMAEQGWDSVGFDPAERAVEAARAQAKKLGVRIIATVARDTEYQWGEAQWDLIILSYVGGREYVADVQRALRPGGMVVLEAFHRDATKASSIGGSVVFDTNELLQLFPGFRVVRYEDTDAVADFGGARTRVVRLAATKP
jgi:SAM-dependent methyltransferase